MAKISIVIPVYNVAPYLRECLDSVLAQTFASWEAICVDDGSTDGSGAILDEYAARDIRFHVIHQANAGVSAARNRGMDEVKGEWIAFLDADDIVRDDWLELVGTMASTHPDVDAIHFGQIEFVDLEAIDWRRSGLSVRLHTYEGEVPEIFYSGGFWGKVYSRRVLGAPRFPLGYVRGEDRLFLAQCVERMRQVVEINQLLYGYRCREGSAMNTKLTGERLLSELWIFEECKLRRSSKKTFSPYYWRKLVQYCTEYLSLLFFTADASDRPLFWDEWKTRLVGISSCKRFPCYYRLVLGAFRAMPFRPVAWFLFYVPQRLKMKGAHR